MLKQTLVGDRCLVHSFESRAMTMCSDKSKLTCVIVFSVGLLFGIFIMQSSASANSVDDFFRQHAGVDYRTFAAQLQVAYKKSHSDTSRANDLFFLQDGSGVRSQNGGKALRLYLRSKDDVGKFIGQYEKIYEVMPVLFVQMDYLDVQNLKGWAMILLTQKKTDESVSVRSDLVNFAEDVRSTIAHELKAKQFPQLHETYRRLDAGLINMMRDSMYWIVLHYTMHKDQVETNRWIQRAEKFDPTLATQLRKLGRETN
ncbi:MAG: hypothetical protein OEU36_19820 [Gammaproteobacteria bacterium]|nr:hypothetical protein [Gammaproteobacteria bacterium]